MSKTRLLRKCMLLFLLLCMIQTIGYDTEPAAAAPIQEIQPMADKLYWRYTIIDGKQYKRLYNATKHKWVGDWIPV